MATKQVFQGFGGTFTRVLGASDAPQATDDGTRGFAVGDEWHRTNGWVYRLTDATTNTAVWKLYAPLPSSLAQGDIFYWDTTAGITKLAMGTNAQILGINAGATAPEWEADD